MTLTTGSPNSVGVRWDFECIRECMKINKICPEFKFFYKNRIKNYSPCVFVLLFTVSSLLELFGSCFIDVNSTLNWPPNSSWSEETVKNKTKTQGESFSFLYFWSKIEFSTYFVYFHIIILLCKFKVPTNSHRVWATCASTRT